MNTRPSPRRPAGHRHRKRFGQHFLSAAWADKVVQAIDVQPNDVLLEIGPGAGAITVPLAATGAPILAVEIDRDLAAGLSSEVPPNVSILTADFLKTDVLPFLTALQPNRPPATGHLSHAERRFRVVGNLPYNISSPILFSLLGLAAATGGVRDAILMLQKEVADRLVAKVGTSDYGVLTVLTAVHADVTRLLSLPPGAFRPPPQVQSAVVRLTFRPPKVDIPDMPGFVRMVRTMFTQRRKTLSNALKPFGLERSVAPVDALLHAAIDARRRPETLDMAEMAALYRAFGQRADTD